MQVLGMFIVIGLILLIIYYIESKYECFFVYNKNNIGNDNFIILKSKTNSSFIHYSGTNNHYRIGMNNGNFGIWNTKDINIINATYLDNNYINFSNVISFWF